MFDVQTMHALHGIIQKWWFAGYSWAKAIPHSTIRNEGYNDLHLDLLATGTNQDNKI